jgi:hypothetical protein
LIILWGEIPTGTVADIYLPAVNADEILQMASLMYTTNRLAKVDANTIRCQTGTATFIPIPSGGGVNFAGLLTVEFPSGIQKGQLFNVTVRQVTSTIGRTSVIQLIPGQTIPRGAPPALSMKPLSGKAKGKPAVPQVTAAPDPGIINWRRVLGIFELKVPVSTKSELLASEEGLLSILRWIEKSIPTQSRWYDVFQRYVGQVAGRVRGMGGDPAEISPSPTGEGRKRHHYGKQSEHKGQGESELSFTGKIAALIYDRFGDFEGFILDTEDGNRRFAAREPEIEQVVNRAWAERIVTSVSVKLDAPHRPEEIVLHCPPRPFEH